MIFYTGYNLTEIKQTQLKYVLFQLEKGQSTIIEICFANIVLNVIIVVNIHKYP